MTNILFEMASGNPEMAADQIASAMRQHCKPMTVLPTEDADAAGNRTYETSGNGIDKVAASITVLGATQVGVTGSHDAAKCEALSDVAVRWTRALIPALAN